jgi:hypothetical protein
VRRQARRASLGEIKRPKRKRGNVFTDDERIRRKRERDAKYRAQNKERLQQWQRDYYQKNPQRRLGWAKAYPERARAWNKTRYASDPAYAAARRWSNSVKQAKRLYAYTSTLARHFRKESKTIYANCPPGYEVDHIHPLLMRDHNREHIACGLHVPWNLQYLSPHDNRSKGNRCPILP